MDLPDPAMAVLRERTDRREIAEIGVFLKQDIRPFPGVL
jgi:hypothetical protein